MSKFCLVLTLVTITGTNWALLQTVAWTSMLADNLCTRSLAESVTRTFDGDYPCPLCRAIAEAKKSEKKTAVLASSQKMEFPPLTEGLIQVQPPHSFLSTPINSSAGLPRHKPPLPPPRAFLA
ncbi:MAG TPA: hypothetical protein VNX46_07450 [Candidatus Acidoferrum sp.]|nr:hypothetical protein [Candidatus Acidoferrum sp.]